VLGTSYGIIPTVEQAPSFHVGLNAHLLSLRRSYRSAGANWYIYNILHHLPTADPELRYTSFLYEPLFFPPQGLDVRRSAWSTGTPIRRIAWEQLVAPFVLRREHIDLLHAMAFVAPVISPCPTVVTVLDLSFLLYPRAFKVVNRSYLRTMTRLSVRKARQVIAISESTRRDVIAHFGVPASRVHTVYCGVDRSLRRATEAEIAAFRRRKGLPERFALFVGTIEPRKNIVRLVEAFSALRPWDVDHAHLVIAGAKGWLYDAVFARTQELGLQDRVHFAGYISEAEKPLWYSAATCFCYPSLYEGFGLPPLEAMACGVPVIASNASSLPEVVGDAAITVPPTDTTALADALRSMLTNRVLRQEMAARGLARAARFSWEQAAKQTASIYRLAWEGT